MMNIAKNFAEIERKFLLLKSVIPSILAISTTQVQRQYLYADQHVEMRIQKKGENTYELERKILDAASPLLRWSMKASITANEFEKLRKAAIGRPINYLKHTIATPGVAIKEYLDQLAGLVIVEVEFADLQTAHDFRPAHSWIGAEITNLSYSRDSGLIHVESFSALAAHLPLS